MLDAYADFLIENVNLEHQNVYLNDSIRLCVLHKSCSPGCYLANGFGFNILTFENMKALMFFYVYERKYILL